MGSLAGIGVQEHWWHCWLSLSDKATEQTLLPGTGSTHILQDSRNSQLCVYLRFPFSQNPEAWICCCGLGQEVGTVKTANEQREGVVMDTAATVTGDVPKEAAVDWEWGCVGMLQHQSTCWQGHLGSYKLIE